MVRRLTTPVRVSSVCSQYGPLLLVVGDDEVRGAGGVGVGVRVAECSSWCEAATRLYAGLDCTVSTVRTGRQLLQTSTATVHCQGE